MEYAGPLFVYAWIYQRPWLFYGDVAQDQPVNQVVQYVQRSLFSNTDDN